MRNCLAKHIKCRCKVEIAHLLPSGICRFRDALATGKASKDVHDHIQALVAGGNVCDRPADQFRLREVKADGLKIRLREVSGADVQRSADDASAGLEKGPGNKRSQRAIGAGNEYSLWFHIGRTCQIESRRE